MSRGLTDIFAFSMRYGGSATNIFRLKPNQALPPHEAALVSIMSYETSSIESTVRLINSSRSDFLALLYRNGLAGLAYQRLSKFLSTAQQNECSTLDLQSLLDTLRRAAVTESVSYDRFDDKFIKFLKILEPLEHRPIWLKGIVSSRTLYAQHSLRLSTDFDFYLSPADALALQFVLLENSYEVIKKDAAFCNQLGVGPTESVEDCFLTPADDMVPSAVIGFERPNWPTVDVKFNPLDRGLRMVELERFRGNSQVVAWRGIEFLAPDLLDQLMVALVHFEKDRFYGYKSLMDLGVLCNKVNEDPSSWTEFLRRVRVEKIMLTCWAGLALTQHRLGLLFLSDVLNELEPQQIGLLRKHFFFTMTPLFYWNTSSLPMLLLNAFMSDDRLRKLLNLRQSLWPKANFLRTYYLKEWRDGILTNLLRILLHWSVLTLPGGVVRRTFGKKIWKY